jgi:hypothetical protein
VEVGVEVNTEKTKYVYLATRMQEKNQNLQVDNKSLKNVEQIKFGECLLPF